MRKLIFIAFALWSFWSNRSHAANIRWVEEGYGNGAITLSGSIRLGDLDRLRTLGESLLTEDVHIRALRLNSSGGIVIEGQNIADWVHDFGLTVEVVGYDECASACFMIFAAGKHKQATSTAQIGVHSAGINGFETYEASRSTVTMARYVADLGVPSTIVGRMVTTPPQNMAWLSLSELRSMGVRVLDPEPRSVVFREPEPTKSVVYRDPPPHAAPKPSVEKSRPAPKPVVKVAKAAPKAKPKVKVAKAEPITKPDVSPVEKPSLVLTASTPPPLLPLPPFPWHLLPVAAMIGAVTVWKV